MKKNYNNIKDALKELAHSLGRLNKEEKENLEFQIPELKEWCSQIAGITRKVEKIADSIILPAPDGTSLEDLDLSVFDRLIPITGWKIKISRADNGERYFEYDSKLYSLENGLSLFESLIPLETFLRVDAFYKRVFLEFAEKYKVPVYKKDYQYAEVFDYYSLYIHCFNITLLNRINHDIEDYFAFHLPANDAVSWAMKEITTQQLIEAY